MPGIPTSDRERECDRAKGDRVRGGASGSGESDKVIMTSSFPTRSGEASVLVVDPGMEEVSLESEGGKRLFLGRCDCNSPIVAIQEDRRGQGEGGGGAVVVRD